MKDENKKEIKTRIIEQLASRYSELLVAPNKNGVPHLNDTALEAVIESWKLARRQGSKTLNAKIVGASQKALEALWAEQDRRAIGEIMRGN